MPNKEGAQSLELQKLAEKFRKDPTSKLFYPLAEEYLKIGLVDEAIPLLRAGIGRHPGLLSARVALGKALQSKGMDVEARAEFEQVIAANPDNIMAQKRLASIYLRAGDKLAALTSCRAVLTVHPSDPEILKIRDDAERLPGPPAQDLNVEDVLSAVPSEEGDEVENEPTVVKPTVIDSFDVEPTVVDATVDSFEAEPTVVEPVPAWGVPEQPDATIDVGPIVETPTDEEPAERGTTTNLQEDELATMSLADLYVAQGHYQQGIEIYRRVLDRVPGHVEAMAKLENALTLDRLLTIRRPEGDALKSDVVRRVVGGVDQAPRDDGAAEAPESESSLVGVSGKRSKHAATIERLESWLAHIVERRRP